MREMSVSEQRYKAILAVIADGRTVSEVASDLGVCRRTMHRWLVRYEVDGLEGLGDRSHRPAHCPHQIPAAVEVMVLEMRRTHAYWGAPGT
jgi:transposase-like protein